MPERTQPRILLITLILAATVAAVTFLFHGAPVRWATDMTGRLFTPIAQRIGYGRTLGAVLLGDTDAATEYVRLQQEIGKLRADSARADELARENKFLRDALGLKERTGQTMIMAGAFAYVREGGVRELVVNKGSRDRVARGDVVITETESLVGAVSEVHQRHSIVRTLGDPALEITARITGTDVSGLVRVDVRQGLVLDLVQKGEQVTEGQQVVTSGNDYFPGGLIIGTVRSVDGTSATLFQIVRLSPTVPEDISANVLIIRP